jgi:hypothetical protein
MTKSTGFQLDGALQPQFREDLLQLAVEIVSLEGLSGSGYLIQVSTV